MQISPLGTYVLAQYPKVETRTKGGLFIPETAQDKKPKLATVLRKGPDCKTSLEVGDMIYFSIYSGINVSSDDSDCILIKEEDIEATVKDV